METEQEKLVVFKGKNIRRQFYNGEWYFSVIDIVSVLTGSENPRRYWSDLKRKLSEEEGFFELYEKIVQLKMTASDGKLRETDSTTAEILFRIIQSIPSSKAEPFKRWLARVGYERVQEIEDPELATKRTRAFYRAKGYSDDWIEKRMRGVAIREELTDQWRRRGIQEEREFSILTAEISKATFGMTPSDYKEHKGLKRENLRDHMTDLELIFSMLGEAATTEITRTRDAIGFDQSRDAARRGGKVAGDAREKLELESGRKVISSGNYLVEKPMKRLKKGTE